MNIQKIILWSFALVLALVQTATAALIPRTAFTYQGLVNDNGAPANGVYDFQFTLYSSTNIPGTIVAGPVTNAATGVSNGLFTVTLDFGGGVFDGSARWLEIAMCTNGAGSFTNLAPRQEITRTPYAIEAVNAITANVANFVLASNIVGAISSGQLPATVVTNGASGVNISGTFTGNGTGVTNVSPLSIAPVTQALAWGFNDGGQTNVPAGLENVVAVAAGNDFSLALNGDGTVVGWGDNTYGEISIPPGLNNAVAVVAGSAHGMALKSDGTVVAWGYNGQGQTNVPAGLSNVVAIAAGTEAGMAVKGDGTVVMWGDNTFGQRNVPNGLSNVVAVGSGYAHSLALKGDGTVVAWGDNSAGQTTIPAGLSNVVAVSAGESHSLALKSDGTVVAWGYNANGQTNVPAGLNNVVAVAAGAGHSLALKSDGTVVAWGYNAYGQTNVPVGLSSVIGLASGPEAEHVLVIQKFPFPVALRAGDNLFKGNQTVMGNVAINGNVTIGPAVPQAPLQIEANTNGGAGWIVGHDSGVGGYTALIAGLSAPKNGYAYLQSVRASGSAIGNIILNPGAGNGNVGIGNTNPANLLVVGTGASPAYCNGTTWVNGSDRNAKEDFAVVNPNAVLEKVSALPITEWKYKVDGDDLRHIGPMAQDFYAAFGLNGSDDKHIATVDESGVALVAIQGLNRKLEVRSERAEVRSQKSEDRIQRLEAENAELKARVEALEKMIGEQKSR